MRIGFYLGRHAGGGGGIGIYAKAYILEALQLLDRQDAKDLQLVFYGESTILDSEISAELNKRGITVLGLTSPTPGRVPQAIFRRLSSTGGRHLQTILDQIVVPLLAARDRIDVLHSLANCGLAFSSRPQVITVHDLFQAWPVEDSDAEHFGSGTGAIVAMRRSVLQQLYRLLFRRQFRSAHHLITDSVSGAREIHRRYGFELARITVIPLGLDPVFLSFWQEKHARRIETEPQHFLERRGLPQAFTIVHASCDPRKNLIRTLRAWQLLPQSYRENHNLVVLGDQQSHDFTRHVLGHQDLSSVHFINWLPRHEIPQLYLHAAVLLLPTLAEGFGLPAIEALALGTAVVSGPLETLSAVTPAQQRLFVCNPRDEASISAALRAALDAPGHSGAVGATPRLSVQPGNNGSPRPRSMGDAVAESFSVYKQFAVRYKKPA